MNENAREKVDLIDFDGKPHVEKQQTYPGPKPVKGLSANGSLSVVDQLDMLKDEAHSREFVEEAMLMLSRCQKFKCFNFMEFKILPQIIAQTGYKNLSMKYLNWVTFLAKNRINEMRRAQQTALSQHQKHFYSLVLIPETTETNEESSSKNPISEADRIRLSVLESIVLEMGDDVIEEATYFINKLEHIESCIKSSGNLNESKILSIVYKTIADYKRYLIEAEAFNFEFKQNSIDISTESLNHPINFNKIIKLSMWEKNLDEIDNFYKKSNECAMKLNRYPCQPVYLSNILNWSVFNNDIKENHDAARAMASNAILE